jgi:hypothetical protein
MLLLYGFVNIFNAWLEEIEPHLICCNLLVWLKSMKQIWLYVDIVIEYPPASAS